MALRGKRPIQEEQRLKVFIYGPPGSGKTLAALQFPNAYIIDTAKETTRYYKLVQKTNSESVELTNPFDVIKELEALRDEKHRFQTVIIDEITTLYQNLQTIWTDKFIQAQEGRSKKKNDSDNLLEDFGYRYWDKVKRDWRRLLDVLRQLDMNVVCNAHQKDKYGDNMKVIGVGSNSDRDDEYVFDFVFRLIVRGKEDYKAICEKQRILPKEIDPESSRFPKEFKWNYENLLKFYNKEYIEKPTKNSGLKETKTETKTKSQQPINNKKEDLKPESKTETKPKTNEAPPTESSNKIDIIKGLFKKYNIPGKEFKSFLIEVCKWKNITTLTSLSEKQKDTIIKFWDSKIIPEFTKFIKNSNKENNSGKKENKKENNEENKKEIVYEPSKPIREDQKKKILAELTKKGVSVDTFFQGFMIKSWEELNQEGAENIFKNLDVMIGVFQNEM